MEYKRFTAEEFVEMFHAVKKKLNGRTVRRMSDREVVENVFGLKYNVFISRTPCGIISAKYKRIILHYNNTDEVVDIDTDEKVKEAVRIIKKMAAKG